MSRLIVQSCALLVTVSHADSGLRGTHISTQPFDGDLLGQDFTLNKRYDLHKAPSEEFDIIEIPDQHLTHSCANYTNDGTTVFSENGKLVLKVASECENGRCLNSGRVMTKTGFKYGLFTISAKVPKCNAIWPALWLLPNNTHGEGMYGRWPCSGEVDLLETVNDQNFGAFNIVAGYGHETGQGCSATSASAPAVCNTCLPTYCTSTTMHWPNNGEDRYFVEDTHCRPGEHSSWAEHTFVLLWEPDRFVAWVDPTFEWDARGHLTAVKKSDEVSADGIPKWRMYHRSRTPTWSDVENHMQTCHNTSERHAPFDIEFKLVLNIAIGGYGGAPCGWGSDACSTVCGANVGSEMVVSDISVWQN